MTAKKPRGYQIEAVQQLLLSMDRGEKDGLLCLPTGSGKTFTTMQFVKELQERMECPVRVLWTAHREELLVQAQNEAKEAGLDVGWERDGTHAVALCTILSTRNLLYTNYDLVIIDEAMHAAAQSYQALRNSTTCDYCLGITATPERLDGKELGFNRIVYQKSFAELVKDGYLAKPKYYRLITGIEAPLRSRGGDFTRMSLMSLDENERNRLIVDWMVSHRDALGRTILFTVNVEHGVHIMDLLVEAGVPESDVRMMQGRSSREERMAIPEWLDATENAILVNCELYTEGMDLPALNSVVLARPTASKALYTQMVGRGCRRTSEKDAFNIIDIVDMNDKYATLSATWALDMEPDIEEGAEDVRRIADQLVEDTTREEIRQLADEVGISITTRAYKDARAEPLDFVAFLTYGSKFWRRHKTVAVTMDQSRAVAKLQILLSRSTRIDATYALCCNEGEYDLQTWEKIAWAYYFRAVRQQETFDGNPKNRTWEWVQLKADLTPKDMQSLHAEITQANMTRRAVNYVYANPRGAQLLWDACKDMADKKYQHSAHVLSRYRPVTFYDMVFRVSIDGMFKDSNRMERNFVKAVLEEVTGYYIGLKVDYLREPY
jgi:superfamily II DNA or RNA helicase